jgi:hypothetical protein
MKAEPRVGYTILSFGVSNNGVIPPALALIRLKLFCENRGYLSLNYYLVNLGRLCLPFS